MSEEKKEQTNRLIHEKSPYLRQHAHNPVDWYPWGEEAFRRAKEEQKPIFLSIGYATCHWCHVMERESFEDIEIAKLMNDVFINIKVDREELPEVDSLYMDFAQSIMTGAAGWPLNLILTPELEPFFATTYLPPMSRQGMVGLLDLIERMRDMWRGKERGNLEAQAARFVDVFSQHIQAKGEELPKKIVVNNSAEVFFKLADPIFGGLKGTPKFPIGYQISFLLRFSSLNQDSRALFIVDKTLDMMQRGGIFDQLGGGFSRYSVDERWLVPHFEKMLYDNAILAQGYLEAWQAEKTPRYEQVARLVLEYLLRDMCSSEGGFYSAEDAESEGKEGFYYTWTVEEIETILSADEASLFCQYYGISHKGNFEGRCVLHTKESAKDFAASQGFSYDEFAEKIEELRKIVETERRKRKTPFKDDKILTSWNSLLIHSLALAGLALNEKRYLKAAEQCATFLKKRLWKDGVLYHRYCDGSTDFRGSLDDYAFLIRALLSLFEARRGVEWLSWAMELADCAQANFKEEAGAFYQSDLSEPFLIVRKCQFSDGAEPSGNGVHAENLLRLYEITGNDHYLKQAEDVLKAVRPHLEAYPPGYSYQMMNIERYYSRRTPLLVIALNEKKEFAQEIQNWIFEKFIPYKSVIWREEGDEHLFSLVPYCREQRPLDGKTTLYLCIQGVCKEPLNDLDDIRRAIVLL